MAIETTELAVISVASIQRENYMAALSLAERIMSETTVIPTGFSVQVYPWTPRSPEINFNFHRDLEALRQFRDEQGLTESIEDRENGSVYVEAVRDDANGIHVVAWTMLSADEGAAAVTR